RLRGAVGVRRVRPVPPPGHDAVPELRVLEDLGHPERAGADRPGGAVARAREEQGAGGHLETALEADRLPDIGRVTLPERTDDVLTNLLELGAERLDVVLGQVREFGYVFDCHEATVP